MEQAIAEWLRGQGTAGIFVSTSGQESPAERILKELRHQPDIKYVRRRRDGERAGPASCDMTSIAADDDRN